MLLDPQYWNVTGASEKDGYLVYIYLGWEKKIPLGGRSSRKEIRSQSRARYHFPNPYSYSSHLKRRRLNGELEALGGPFREEKRREKLVHLFPRPQWMEEDHFLQLRLRKEVPYLFASSTCTRRMEGYSRLYIRTMSCETKIPREEIRKLSLVCVQTGERALFGSKLIPPRGLPKFPPPFPHPVVRFPRTFGNISSDKKHYLQKNKGKVSWFSPRNFKGNLTSPRLGHVMVVEGKKGRWSSSSSSFVGGSTWWNFKRGGSGPVGNHLATRGRREREC